MTVKQVFLLDSMGAALSVLLLGVVLPAVQPSLGMPGAVLDALALWATACLVYSLTCWRFQDLADARWLMGIMVANVFYTLLTLALVFVHRDALTTLGFFYFIAELPVIWGLVLFERRVYRGAYGRD